MYTFEHKGKQYNVCSSWEDVTIRHALTYAQIPVIEAAGLLEDEPSEMGPAERLCWVVAALSDIPLSLIPFDLIESRSDLFVDFAEAISFTVEPFVMPPDKHSFIHRGVEYFVNNPFTSEPLGKYITIERKILKLEKVIEKINSGDFAYLPEFVAIIVSTHRKAYKAGEGITKEAYYDGTEAAIAERTAELRDMKLMDALAIRGFFFANWTSFERDSKSFSPSMKKPKSTRLLSRIGTAGKALLTILQRVRPKSGTMY